MPSALRDAVPEPAAAAAAADRRLALRLRMVALAWGSWCTDAAMLALLAFWAGMPEARDALATVLLGGSATCAAFALAFRRGWHLRWRDRFLTVPQLLAASAVILLAAWQSPSVAVPLLSMLFVVFAFAALRLTPTHLLVSWAGITVALAVVVSRTPGTLSMPGGTPLQAALSTVWWSLVIGRCALLGLYGATLRQQLVERGRELADATGRLRELAMRDALTGALSRGATMDALDDAVRAHAAGGPAVGVALVDLDHFKGINDRFGHPVGDEVLVRVVEAAARVTREADRIGRWGGEEFLLLLPACDAPAAAAIAERLRSGIAAQPWHELAGGLAVTASIGVAVARRGAPPAELLSRADRALYRAKHAGRDRVHVDG
jgi:diguanylate cyclase (GGDEF)-like protein